MAKKNTPSGLAYSDFTLNEVLWHDLKRLIHSRQIETERVLWRGVVQNCFLALCTSDPQLQETFDGGYFCQNAGY